LADAAAALTGSTYGTRFFRIEDGQKSVEGSAVFFLMTLLDLDHLPDADDTVAAAQHHRHLDDGRGLRHAGGSRKLARFRQPVPAAGPADLPVGPRRKQLARASDLAGLFAVSILVFKRVAADRPDRHAAHVYVTAVFLLLAFTAVQNAIIPILVLAAHAWSRSAAPSDARFPDLDIVAALALVSFGWLASGTATGLNAVSFYGVTAMGMVMGLSAIALSRQAAGIRVGAFCDRRACRGLLLRRRLQPQPRRVEWNGPMWGLVIASMGLAALAPTLLPRVFSTDRVARLTALSLAMPLSAYLFALGTSP
jgi:phytol kinase